MKTFLKVFSLLVLGGALLFGWGTWLNLQIEKTDIKSEVMSVTDYSNYPAVVNIAPTNAYVDKTYSYTLKIVDQDTDMENIQVNLFEGPKWLLVNGFEVYGIPLGSDIGTSKITLRVSDGSHVVYEQFYILVQQTDEAD